MNKILDYLTENDLTEDLQLIASVCGMDCVRKLMENLSGTSFYVPRISKLHKFIERYVGENNDKSLVELARTMGVSCNFLKKKFRQSKYKGLVKFKS